VGCDCTVSARTPKIATRIIFFKNIKMTIKLLNCSIVLLPLRDKNICKMSLL